MTSLNIHSGAFIGDAQEISSEYFGDNPLFDRAGEDGSSDEKALTGAQLEKHNLDDQQLSSIRLFRNLISDIYYENIESIRETIEIDNLFSDWREKFPTFEIDTEQQDLITNFLNSDGFSENGWNVRLISELLTRSDSFSCLHFVSFVMHRKGIAADRAVYNTLSSNGFFTNFDIDSPEFGVSKYTPDYFSTYISESSSFSEAMERISGIIRRYCGPTSGLFDALSSKATTDQDVLDIFQNFGDDIQRSKSKLLTQNFFSNIEMHISNISTLLKVFSFSPTATISVHIMRYVVRYENSTSHYDDVVKFMSDRELSINEKDLAAWVLDSPSLEEASKRVRLAFRNNPSGFECYSSSLGDWVSTSDEFAVLKKLDEELRHTTDWL